MSNGTDRLSAIREKVEAGRRLSFEDGLALEASNDLFALGSMANLVRERYNGNFGYYNVNTHINPTNVCVYTCDFLRVSGRPGRSSGLCDGPGSDRRTSAAGQCAWGNRAAYRGRPA